MATHVSPIPQPRPVAMDAEPPDLVVGAGHPDDPGALLAVGLFVSLVLLSLLVITRRRGPARSSTPHVEPPPATKARSPGGVPAPVPPTTLKGPVSVVDGDSIVLARTEIRLFGIDAPELTHPYGQKAKWALVALCKGREVSATIVARDIYGRKVAKCHLPDGRDLSAEMVRAGLAIDWPKFSGGAYRHLEVADARKKMWLADARQKGRMHVWRAFEAQQRRGRR